MNNHKLDVVYHVVTEKPMFVGQKIIFDDNHHSGVYQRVYDKINIVNDIYENPDNYQLPLEHHVSVALRELALEEVRKEKYPNYPSRMSCLYVSSTFEQAVSWADYFISIGRPIFQIVKLKVEGNYFIGDANNCFEGKLKKEENIMLANKYWEGKPDKKDSVYEMIVDGNITVLEILKEYSNSKAVEENE